MTSPLSPLKKLAFAAITAAAALVVVEVGFRGVVRVASPEWDAAIANFREQWMPVFDPILAMQPHPYYAYINAENFVGDEGVNADGFYGPLRARHKKKDTFRIGAMGGSTTAGPFAWPHQLQRQLEQRGDGVTYEVMNFGVSGWTTAESMASFVSYGQDFELDLLVVHHAVNDIPPMQRGDYRPDYTHYRRPLLVDADEQGRQVAKNYLGWTVDTALCRASSVYVAIRLLLVGNVRSLYTLYGQTTWEGPDTYKEPPERNAGGFKRNLRTLDVVARSVGTQLVLTTMPYSTEIQMPEEWPRNLDRQNARVLALAGELGAPSIDLAAQMMARTDEFHFEDQVHLELDGKQLKARLVLEGLEAAGLLPAARP
jgi:lysophospholipase L1-like esterase